MEKGGGKCAFFNRKLAVSGRISEAVKDRTKVTINR